MYIDKPNSPGEKRPLGIPNFNARVAQQLFKFTLEPLEDYDADEFSFGFRVGRSVMDALKTFEHEFKQSHWDYLYVLDVSKCFDRISHTAIMEKVDFTSQLYKNTIWAMLKGPIIDGHNIIRPEMGTPQGSTPVMCNLVLNILKSNKVDNRGRIRVIRYADDCTILIKGDPNID